MITPIGVPGPSLRIVVLAAGFSRRLGRSKALSGIRGVSLLVRTVRLVTPFSTGAVIVVLPPRAARARAQLEGLAVDIVESRERARGLSASVRAGLRRARYAAAVLLLPVDLPYLARRDLERLVARWRAARRRVTARRAGDRAAAPLILPRRLRVGALGIAGDRGLGAFVNGAAIGPRLVDLAGAARDVDTPEDLARARRRLRP